MSEAHLIQDPGTTPSTALVSPEAVVVAREPSPADPTANPEAIVEVPSAQKPVGNESVVPEMAIGTGLALATAGLIAAAKYGLRRNPRP